jgi:glycosyltransferase involved in cell wall biosynthesis
MSTPQVALDEAGSSASDLVVRLERVMPLALTAGRAAALFCIGSCFHRSEAVKELAIVADGVRHRVAAFGMPRPDLAGRAYRSGFWATVPIRARATAEPLELWASVRLGSGPELTCPLTAIETVDAPDAPSPPVGAAAGDDVIAVCMATFEPDMKLFRTQIDSLRAQIDRRWICLISDDCSSPERFGEIQRLLTGDDRFVISRSDERLGFYRNFERALSMVPAGTRLVALADQDDRWNPEKLDALRGALGDAILAYSDQRLTDADGRVLRNTLWKGRRNNSSNLASQVVANTITGAAMLFRRELLDVALPFPEGPGFLFHDHWLGMAAMAIGELAFVDRPLYDYVQHAGAVFGDVSSGPRRRFRLARRHFGRWRAAYFYGYVSREVQAQTLLVRCRGRLPAHKRRALLRFVNAANNPLALAWLAARPLRLLAGRSETLGSEADLVRGILWRRLVPPLARAAAAVSSRAFDSRLPDPAIFEQRRLRRWRSRV